MTAGVPSQYARSYLSAFLRLDPIGSRLVTWFSTPGLSANRPLLLVIVEAGLQAPFPTGSSCCSHERPQRVGPGPEFDAPAPHDH